MRGEVHILVHCPIDTLQWGSTHSALVESHGMKLDSLDLTSPFKCQYWSLLRKMF